MSPKVKPIKPVAVYTRVSEQGRRSDEELLSHEIQRRKIEQALASKDIPVSPETFEDTDVSGRKMNRPAFDRAIKGVLAGRYGGIAVARLSRFGRNTAGILQLIYELEAAGAAVIILDPPIDTSTAAGRAMLTVFSAFVTMEAEQAAEQAALAAELKWERGEGFGGKPPVGYEFEVKGHDTNGKPIRGGLVTNVDAPAVRSAFELKAAGGTYGQVADLLNERGVRTLRGNPWRIASARTFLRNEVYTGVLKYGDRRREKAHEEIVPTWLWRKCQPKPSVPVTRTRGEGHVLGQGLCRCGKCSGGLTKGNANGKYSTVRCLTRGPGHASASYLPLADYIINAALAHYGTHSGERHEGGNAREVEAAKKRLAQAREGLAEVEALRGSVAPASFALAHSDAVADVEEAEDTLGALDQSEGIISKWWYPAPNDPETGDFTKEEREAAGFKNTRDLFDELPVPDQRRGLASVIERVTLRPGRGPLTERVKIEFTDGTVYAPPAVEEPDGRTFGDVPVFPDGIFHVAPMGVQKKRARKAARA
jgi:site-specific DNA recombinase